MAKDNPEWVDPWEADPYKTGRFTGRKGNEGMAVWNPETNKIEKYTIDDWLGKSREARRDGGDNLAMFYTNKFGEDVYGYRPEEKYQYMKPGGESWYAAGEDPFAGNRERIPDPNNNTPVPISIANPDYDPNLVIDRFEPPQEGGPEVVYPDGGTSGGDPFRPPSYVVEDSVFEPFNPDISASMPSDFSTDFRLGEDSPWGNAGVEGGNRDFYRQQLNNLRAQEQNYQEGALAAAMRREAAAQNPDQMPDDPWGWAYGGKGLPSVGVAGGTVDNPTAYGLRSSITPGQTSNADLIRMFGGDNAGKIDSWLSNGSDLENQYNWSQAGSPQELINALSRNQDELATSNYDWLSGVYNNMFTQQGIETPEGGGPSAAPGYAMPIGVR